MISVGELIAIIASAQFVHVGVAFVYRQYIQDNNNNNKIPYFQHERNHFRVLRWAMLCLVILSWICSYGATASCTFLQQTLSVKNEEYHGSLQRSLGLHAFQEEEGQSCKRESIGDDRFETAFSFALLNCLFTTIGMVFLLLVQCKIFQTPSSQQDSEWAALQWIMYSSLWCCLLTFYVQHSTLCHATHETFSGEFNRITGLSLFDADSTRNWQMETTCSLGDGGHLQVSNVFLLVGINILGFLLPPQHYNAADDDDDDEGDDEESTDESIAKQTPLLRKRCNEPDEQC